jgi:hypothetical protein
MINTHTMGVEKGARIEAHGAFTVFEDSGRKGKHSPRLHITVNGSEVLYYFESNKELAEFKRELKRAFLQAEHGYDYAPRLK